jgi:hypothetical protein
MASNEIVNFDDWVPSAVWYTKPRIDDKGGKSVGIISTRSNRSLQISTPFMITWGIDEESDYVTGEPNGKFTMSLKFPNDDYSTTFLDKLKEFEKKILDDAVTYSKAWFGKVKSNEVVKDNFSPFLKYPKDNVTQNIDDTKPPTISAKVPNYNGKWIVEVYDTNSKLLFPCDNENMTPMDFVPKGSKVAAVLQCNGIWFVGGSWGVTWKVIQCVVKSNPLVAAVEENDEESVDAAVEENDEESVVSTTAVSATAVSATAISALLFLPLLFLPLLFLHCCF